MTMTVRDYSIDGYMFPFCCKSIQHLSTSLARLMHKLTWKPPTS